MRPSRSVQRNDPADDQARYQLLAENTTDVIAKLTTDGTFVYMSPAVRQLAGYESEELIGASAAQFIYSEADRERWSQWRTALLAGGAETPVAFRLRKKNGDPVWVESTSHPIRNPKTGEVEYTVSVTRDITARIRAEAALVASERRFRALIERSHDGIVLMSRDGRFLYASPSCATILGYAPEELAGTNAFDLLHPDDLELTRATYGDVLASPATVRQVEYRLRARDGEWKWIEGVGQNLLEDPQVNAVVVNFRDVTDRKVADEALVKSEATWRSLVGNAPDYISMIDLDGTIEFANRAAPGVRVEDLLGTCVYDYVAPEGREEMRRVFAEVARTTAPATLEVQAMGPYGDRSWYRIRVGPLLLGSQVVRLMSISTDVTAEKRWHEEVNSAHAEVELQAAELARTVEKLHEQITERRRVEREVRRSRSRLRALSRNLLTIQEEERRSLARDVHDDLGQLLTAIKIEADASLRRCALPREVRGDCAGKLDLLIDATINAVRRIATGLRPGALDDLGLVPAIEGLVQEFEERTGIFCQLRMGPEADLQLDPTRATTVFRVIQEILTNVTRHANATRVRLSLTVRSEVLRLMVKDNGRGIREEEIQRRTSLGLIGIRERVRLCHGQVQFRGTEGMGTSVRVKIPLGDVATSVTQP